MHSVLEIIPKNAFKIYELRAKNVDCFHHKLVYLAFVILLHSYLEPYIVNGVKQPKSFDPDLEKDIMGSKNGYRSSGDDDDTMLCKRVVTKDRRYITQITCFEKGTMSKEKESSYSSNRNAMRLPVFGKQTNGGALASLFSFPRRQLFGGTSNVKTSHTNKNLKLVH